MKLTESQRRHLEASAQLGVTVRCGFSMGYNRGVARRLEKMGLVRIENEYAGKYGTLEIKATAAGRKALQA